MPHATLALSLVPHPATPDAAVRSLTVEVKRTVQGLTLRYLLTGDIRLLRIPPLRNVARADGLWRHTCFEAFIAGDGSGAYREFNFSPSGEWAAYRFTGYRQGGAPLECPAPRVAVRSSAERLELESAISLTGERLHIGLSAVVEHAEGALSYWAIAHPSPTPDFHNAAAFALQVDEVRH